MSGLAAVRNAHLTSALLDWEQCDNVLPPLYYLADAQGMHLSECRGYLTEGVLFTISCAGIGTQILNENETPVAFLGPIPFCVGDSLMMTLDLLPE